MKFRFLLVSLFLIKFAVLGSAQSQKTIHMFLPDRKGALELSLPGFQIQKGGLRPDGKQFTITAENPNGIFLTAFVELAPRPGTSTQVRDDWWGGLKKNSKAKMDEQKLSESGDVAITEYVIHETQGVYLEQKNLHAYYGGDEIWAEVHISKVEFHPGDQKLFSDVLSRVKFLPSYVPDSREEFIAGSTYYRTQDYQRAALHYQKSLDLEKEKPALNQTLTRVLIDQLGMSYGISKQLDKSKAVFEYGISKDPDYPMYYYNIACGYGEQNDKANAIAYLKKAFDRKANVIKSEKMPDPLTDDSFRSFVADTTFVNAVKEMQK
jgi:tetratricopeptide (TPR) repeat protein